MTDIERLRRSVERALAHAHAAVDQPTAWRILEAKTRAAEVLPRIERLESRAFTLAEARALVPLVAQLRAVLHVLDRQTHDDARVDN